MKTAEEWTKKLDTGYDQSLIELTELIKAIQLDAWKAGIKYAADEIVIAANVKPEVPTEEKRYLILIAGHLGYNAELATKIKESP